MNLLPGVQDDKDQASPPAGLPVCSQLRSGSVCEQQCNDQFDIAVERHAGSGRQYYVDILDSCLAACSK
jgi:hypothetical protein